MWRLLFLLLLFAMISSPIIEILLFRVQVAGWKVKSGKIDLFL